MQMSSPPPVTRQVSSFDILEAIVSSEDKSVARLKSLYPNPPETSEAPALVISEPERRDAFILFITRLYWYYLMQLLILFIEFLSVF